MPAATSSNKHAHLSALLGVRESAVASLFRRYPNLLNMPARQLVPRMQRLSAVLEVGMDQVLLLVARQPAVLTAPPSMFLEKAFEMETKMGLPKVCGDEQKVSRRSCIICDVFNPCRARL